MFTNVHSRYRLPASGDKAWAIRSVGHALPAGLAERRRLFILILDTHAATVGDPSGREWVLPYDNLETVQEYFIDEQWLPESDPRSLAHIRRMIVAEQDQPMLEGVGEFAVEWVQRLKWILERNGAKAEPNRGRERSARAVVGVQSYGAWPNQAHEVSERLRHPQALETLKQAG